jgi:hypothetical protein
VPGPPATPAIGPGSEWLWTAVSGIVLALTFIAIYRQLRMQRDTAAIEQLKALDREWLGSERMARMRVAALRAIRDGTDPTDIPPRVLDIIEFWEAVSHLVRSGHLSGHLVNDQRSQSIRMWWGWMAPIIRAERQRRDAPWIGQNFEWLANLMAEMDREARRMTSFDDAYLARMLPSMLEYNLDMVRLAEELRAATIPPIADAGATPQLSML